MGFTYFQSESNKQKKIYSLFWPNLEVNIEVYIPLISVLVENKKMNIVNNWPDFADISDSWDERYFRNPV